MKRKDFLKTGSLAGIAITSLAVHSTAHAKSAPRETAFGPDNFPLNEMTIADLQQLMHSGKQTAESLTRLYLARIDAIDKKGPAINAVIEVNPDAIAIAQQLDKERKSRKLRGPLHGIPILVKDNIDTGDKMMTTAGALALVGNIASKDAFIIQKLREAGAVLLGKTNLSEWANFRSTRSTSGWSSRGGQTKNPVMLDRNPCGSSSGSGAAVAANLCAVAIGTETDGSIIAPSSFCGIVGIKPTVGLWSRSGIIPISSTQDTPGPMARTVRDAAVLLGALIGTDPADAVTAESESKRQSDYTKYLDAGSLHGKRIGIEKSHFEGNEDVVALYKAAIETLKLKGATIVEVELLKACRDGGGGERDVLRYEFKAGVNAYLSNAKAPVKSLSDVIAFNKAHAAKAMPWFKQETLEICEKKDGLDSPVYQEALKKATSNRTTITELMKSQSLDAICGISIGLPCCIDLINGDYDTDFYFCPPAARAGFPHITVPMGKVHELPAGLSFMANAYEEPKLLGMAYAYEQASKKREAPRFIPSWQALSAGR